MKFFGSSLDIRDNLKVAFFGKILSNMSWHLPQKRIAPLLYLVINMTDWLSRVFVEIAVSLSNSSRERSINSTERQAQGASATCNKNFTGRSQLNTVGQCQIYWEAGPQTSAQVSCTDSAPTVIQLHRLDNSIKSEPVTRFMLGLVDFFPKKATFKLSLMSNDENKFLPIFQILHINNVWFLLKLAMALVTSIVMKFAPVCLGYDFDRKEYCWLMQN